MPWNYERFVDWLQPLAWLFWVRDVPEKVRIENPRLNWSWSKPLMIMVGKLRIVNLSKYCLSSKVFLFCFSLPSYLFGNPAVSEVDRDLWWWYQCRWFWFCLETCSLLDLKLFSNFTLSICNNQDWIRSASHGHPKQMDSGTQTEYRLSWFQESGRLSMMWDPSRSAEKRTLSASAAYSASQSRGAGIDRVRHRSSSMSFETVTHRTFKF